MPAVAEEIEVNRPARMRCDHVLVEGDAETGAGRQWEGAVHDRGNAASCVADERIHEVVEVLEDLEVGRHRREVPGLGPLAIATAATFLAQVAVGAANPLTGFSPWALGAHPAAASALWCSVVALTVLAWRPAAGQRALARDLIALTKPAIMSLLLVTALGGMFLAARGVPPFGVTCQRSAPGLSTRC